MVEAFRRLVGPLSPCYLAELRWWVRAWMVSRRSRVDTGDVVLAMTELVSNSVRHGYGPVDVELSTTGERLLLQVSDGSDELPGQRMTDDANSEGGRGLLLTAGLASQWGVRLNGGGGKTVWCEFAPQP